MNETSKLLTIEQLSKGFGGIKAVSELDFFVNQGDILGLIGPNGAGKTTVFNLITGVYKSDYGNIIYSGNNIVDWPPSKIDSSGIARTFQNLRLFKNLTVLDNVKIAFHSEANYNLVSAFFRGGNVRKSEKLILDKAMNLLKIVGLETLASRNAGNLAYGVARKLEIARALALKPKIILLDEPAAGMNPGEINELKELIHLVFEKFGLTIILVEHRMDLVMSICNRIVVLDFGRKIAEGLPWEIQQNEEVLKAYLGEEYRNVKNLKS